MNNKSGIKNLLNFSSTQTNRFGWIDYAKGIAIILVVYRHVGFGLKSNGANVNQWILDLNDMFYSFRMPLFFILSGLFFGKSMTKRGTGGFILTKVNTLLYPYILWSILQITLQMVFHEVAHAQRGVADYLNIIIQPRANNQLWYLFALFNVTLLYLFMSKLFKNNNYWQLLLAVIFIALAPFANRISTFYDIMIHYIFFCLGNLAAPYFFDEKIQHKLSSGYALLMLLPVFISLQYYFLYHQDMNLFMYAFIAVVGSLFTIMLSFLLDKHKWLPFLRITGHYSLYIYVLHVPIVSFIRYFLLRNFTLSNIPLLMIVLISLAVFLSIITYRLCRMLKLNFLFIGPFKQKTKAQFDGETLNPTA
ncbi:putative membrane protein YcfT [Chitinophaga niastensis]|uniref:Putative membrane protein YcfT n=1 Tax=Chitinophaga niastensis TaxID=536980 RepID=A0A2P8HBZ1_CHINA|nr:acyltransferase [Chitinophaga niastensis]PSL43749.1 putative membrane protein YcfT [Chitinophaga niastensis]